MRVNVQMNYEGGENGTTWVYAYDRGGNVLSKTRYAYTTGALGTAQKSIAYSYDSVWKDKLTQYGSKVIQSDAQGNVTHDSHWAYSWENGRRLKSMSTISQTMTFTYDENGQRIRKSYAGVTTDYTVQGKRIVHVKSSDSTLGEMHIYYDGDRPDMVLYDGATYRYVHSLQGDILGLQDSTGEMVVVYRYDPWVRPVWLSGSMSETLGALNPFRYRGYVYDAESGLYYLRSRYYNPNWGRFLSADSILGQVGGLLQHNLWAYCCNSPVFFVDQDGTWPGRYHFQVQRDIIERHPDLISEVSIARLTGSAGRVDLYCPITGECWEIKPAKYYVPGMAQLMDYIYGTWKEKYKNKRKIRGGYISGNMFMFEGKLVSYSYAGYGVIVYSVYEPINVPAFVPERTSENNKGKKSNSLSFPVPNANPVTVITGVAATALILVAMRGGGGVPHYIREMA